MKIHNLIVILILGMFFVSGCQIYQAIYPVEIPKENNTFEEPVKENVSIKSTSSKISPSLKSKLMNTNLENLHLLIEFNKLPNIDERKNIERYGIIFHSYIGNNTWKVTLPVDIVNNLTILPEIKIIRDILIDAKLSHEVEKNEFHSWAKHGNGEVSVYVTFFSDVNQQKAEELLIKHNAKREYMSNELGYGPGPDNLYQVKLLPIDAVKLAEEDEVNYISEITGPADILKRGRYATFSSLVRSKLFYKGNNSTRLLVIFLVLGGFLAGIVISQIAESNKSYDLSDFPDFMLLNRTSPTLIVTTNNPTDLISSVDISNLACPAKGCPVAVPTYAYGSRDNPNPSKYIAEVIWEGDVKNLTNQNIISVGGPCANKITAQIMNVSQDWPTCATGFEEGKGRLILYNKWGEYQLIVAGFTADDTRKSAEVVANYQGYNLSGFQREVIGKRGNLSVIFREFDNRGTKIDAKVHPYLKQPTQPSWIDNGDGTWNLMIQCYYEINTTQCRDRLQTYGEVKERIGINLFVVRANKDKIRSIAEDDYVLAIDRGPGPAKPTSE